MFEKGGSTLPVIFQSAENPKNQYYGLKECLEQRWAEPETHLMLEGIGGIGKTIALLNMADSMDIPVIYIPLSIPWLQSHSIRYREPSIPNDRAT